MKRRLSIILHAQQVSDVVWGLQIVDMLCSNNPLTGYDRNDMLGGLDGLLETVMCSSVYLSGSDQVFEFTLVHQSIQK